MPPPSLLFEALWQAVLPAGLTSLLVLAGFLRATEGRAASVGLALALAAGYAAGNYLRGSVPWIPEGTGWPLLPLAGLAALSVSLLAALPSFPRALLLLAFLLLAGAATWLLVPPELWTARWPAGLFFLAVAAELVVLTSASRVLPGALVPACLAGCFLAGSVVLLHAHSARLSELGLLLACPLAGAALSCSLWKVEPIPAGALAGGVLPGLLLAGQTETFSEVPLASFVLVALAPLSLGLGLLPPFRKMPALWRNVALALLVLLPLLIALALAVRAEPNAFEGLG